MILFDIINNKLYGCFGCKVMSSTKIAEEISAFNTKSSRIGSGFLVAIIISFIGAFWSAYYWFAYTLQYSDWPVGTPEKISFIVGAILFGICLISGITFVIVRKCVMSGRKKELYHLKSELDIQKRIEATSLKLYNLCASNGIYEITKENEDDFMLVAKQLDIDWFESAKFYFEKGYILAENERAHNKQLNAQKLIEQVQEYLNKAQANSAITGKEKYLLLARKKLEQSELQLKVANTAAHLSGTEAKMAANERPRDWASAGGLASAIAGPAAGVAVAADIQAKNAHDDATRADRIKQSMENQSFARSAATTYKQDVEKHKELIESIESAIVDNNDKYFEMLNFTVLNPTVDDTGNIKFNIRAQITDENQLQVLNKPALIDGSVYVYVCDNGRRIGQTVVCAPDFSSVLSKDMGFSNLKEVVYCKPDSGKKFSGDKTYTFEYEPCHVWAVQKW